MYGIIEDKMLPYFIFSYSFIHNLIPKQKNERIRTSLYWKR